MARKKIRGNLGVLLTYLGRLYGTPANAIKEYVSNALDEWIKASGFLKGYIDADFLKPLPSHWNFFRGSGGRGVRWYTPEQFAREAILQPNVLTNRGSRDIPAVSGLATKRNGLKTGRPAYLFQVRNRTEEKIVKAKLKKKRKTRKTGLHKQTTMDL